MRRTLIPGEKEIHIYKNFSATLGAVPGVVEVRGPLGVPGTSRSPSSRLSDQETVLRSPTRGACAAFFISSTLLVPFWCTVLMVRLADAVSDCWLHQSMAFHLSASPPHQLESLAAESGTTRLDSLLPLCARRVFSIFLCFHPALYISLPTKRRRPPTCWAWRRAGWSLNYVTIQT